MGDARRKADADVKAENERLRDELTATSQKLAQAEAALVSERGNLQGEKQEVAVPVESTPLVTPPPAPGGHGPAAVTKALMDHKGSIGAVSSFSQTCLGLGFALSCLLIFYLNGGDATDCSTPLPLFLKVNGYASLAYLLTSACLTAAAPNAHKQQGLAGCVACLTGCVGCFLLAWGITGLVWFFTTNREDCDFGLYKGTMVGRPHTSFRAPLPRRHNHGQLT